MIIRLDFDVDSKQAKWVEDLNDKREKNWALKLNAALQKIGRTKFTIPPILVNQQTFNDLKKWSAQDDKIQD